MPCKQAKSSLCCMSYITEMRRVHACARASWQSDPRTKFRYRHMCISLWQKVNFLEI